MPSFGTTSLSVQVTYFRLDAPQTRPRISSSFNRSEPTFGFVLLHLTCFFKTPPSSTRAQSILCFLFHHEPRPLHHTPLHIRRDAALVMRLHTCSLTCTYTGIPTHFPLQIHWCHLDQHALFPQQVVAHSPLLVPPTRITEATSFFMCDLFFAPIAVCHLTAFTNRLIASWPTKTLGRPPWDARFPAKPVSFAAK